MNKETEETGIIELVIMVLILSDAILLLGTIFYNLPPLTVQLISGFDLLVCLVLFADYINRMRKTSLKKKFIINNWYDIIAMLPDVLFTSIFGLTGLSGVAIIIRLFRLVRVARVLVLFRKNINLFTTFIQETHLDKLLSIVVIIVIIASTIFYFVDNSINSFVDSLWYVLVTLTTVGYGDIVPTTTTGKVIGIILIIIGLVIFGTLTGAITSLYTRRIEKESREELEEKLNRIEKKLDTLLDENNNNNNNNDNNDNKDNDNNNNK